MMFKKKQKNKKKEQPGNQSLFSQPEEEEDDHRRPIPSFPSTPIISRFWAVLYLQMHYVSVWCSCWVTLG
jgi:hypothetical protein